MRKVNGKLEDESLPSSACRCCSRRRRLSFGLCGSGSDGGDCAGLAALGEGLVVAHECLGVGWTVVVGVAVLLVVRESCCLG